MLGIFSMELCERKKKFRANDYNKESRCSGDILPFIDYRSFDWKIRYLLHNYLIREEKKEVARE